MILNNSIFNQSTSLDVELEAALASGIIADTETVSESDDFIADFAEDCYKLEAAVYVADIQLESAALEGASVETMTENVITDMLEKAKAAILKLWNKLQTWFNEKKSAFRAWANASVKFITTNQTKIIKRIQLHKTITVTSVYMYGKPDGSTISVTASDLVDGMKSLVPDVRGGTKPDDDMITNKLASVLNVQSSENTIGSIFSEYMKKLRGAESPSDLTFKQSDIEAMIGLNKSAEFAYKKIGTEEMAAKKAINTAINSLKDAKKHANDDNKEHINNTIKYWHKVTSLVSRLCTTNINLLSELFKQNARVLREVAALPDKTEDGAAAKESFSLLDDAYDII